MASLFRFAAISAARSAAFRSKPVLPKSLPCRRASPLISRSVYAALGITESMMPLHNAVASARLKSFIAIDSSHWSWLTQGLKEGN